MTSLLSTKLRVAMMALGLGAAALATGGCAADGSIDDEIGQDQTDDGLDEADDADDPSELVEQVDDSGLPDPTFICHPDEIEGRVLRLSLENGAMKARGTVWSNVAPCIVHLNVQLFRDGQRIDSADKSCGDESCKSRLLSAANPPGNQTFCVNVRQTSTGSLLDRQCKVR
jgi:hypothetical protein